MYRSSSSVCCEMMYRRGVPTLPSTTIAQGIPMFLHMTGRSDQKEVHPERAYKTNDRMKSQIKCFRYWQFFSTICIIFSIMISQCKEKAYPSHVGDYSSRIST